MTKWTDYYPEQAHALAYALLMADIEMEPEAAEDDPDADPVDSD